MKPILTALLLTISAMTNAQVASRLLPSQSHVQPINAKNIVWVDTVAGGQQRIWVADRDSLKLYTFQIRGVKDSVQNWGDSRYPQLTATYFNPTFIGSIAANKLTGLNATMISSALGYVPADSLALSGKLNINDTTSKWLGLGYIPTWASISGKPTIPAAQVNSDWGAVAGVAQILNKPTIPTNTNQLTNGAGFITGITGSMVNTAIGGTALKVTDTISLSNRINASFQQPTITNSVARTLNSNFTVSTTKNSFVTYSVTCSATNPLLAGSSTATAFLEYSTNAGSSWITVSQQSATSSVALAVAVAITQAQTAPISGWIPANALVRLRSTTTGTANVVYVSGQETTF